MYRGERGPVELVERIFVRGAELIGETNSRIALQREHCSMQRHAGRLLTRKDGAILEVRTHGRHIRTVDAVGKAQHRRGRNSALGAELNPPIHSPAGIDRKALAVDGWRIVRWKALNGRDEANGRRAHIRLVDVEVEACVMSVTEHVCDAEVEVG